MADQTIEIRLVLRDELSRQLAPINQQLRQLASHRVDAAHASFQRLAPVVRVVHRELSTLSRLTLGGLVGGGVVAGIATAVRGMQDMARQQLQLHYTAQQLGVSTKFIENYRDALTGLGEAPEAAAASIKQALATLDEFQVKGEKSSLGKFLEDSIGGSAVAARLHQVIAKQGEEAGLEFLISYGKRIKDRRGQAEFFKQAGLPFAAKDVAEILPLLGKRVQLSTEQMKALAIANMQYERSSRNIGLILGSELTPAVTKVMKALDDYLRTESGKKFAKQIGDIAKQVSDAISDWITKGGLEKTLDTLKAAFKGADDVIQAMGLSWPKVIAALALGKFASSLIGVANAIRMIMAIPGAALILGGSAAFYAWLSSFRESKDPTPGRKPYTTDDIRRRMEDANPSIWRRKTMEDWLQPWVLELIKPLLPKPSDTEPQPQPQSGQGKPETEQERRAAQAADERERDALNRELQQLAESTGHLADYLTIGGPEGTADGRSGFQFGGGGSSGSYDPATGMPVLGPAGGGRSNRPFPTLPPEATTLSRILGTPRPAQMQGTGFASVYGNRPDLGFIDPQDKGREGVKESEQGIALGPKETRGQYHYLTDPNTGLTHVTRQTDTGPNIRTQKLLDIHASQWNRMGYTAAQAGAASGKGLWNVSPAGFGQAGQEAAWAGRGGGFEESGVSPITQYLARQDMSATGSATVDIDVSSLGTGARNPSVLFKPQPMDGAVQMQNAHHVPDNRLSFQ
jgi:hypothetical protein